jgi:hypothetical protein
MNKKILGLAGVVALAAGVLAVLPGAVFASYRDPAAKGPNYTAERHDALEKAFDTNDFDAWQKLMTGRGRVTQVVTRDNFATFAKIHQLTDEGKTAEAEKLRTELGLGTRTGFGQGRGQGAGMMHAR